MKIVNSIYKANKIARIYYFMDYANFNGFKLNSQELDEYFAGIQFSRNLSGIQLLKLLLKQLLSLLSRHEHLWLHSRFCASLLIKILKKNILIEAGKLTNKLSI